MIYNANRSENAPSKKPSDFNPLATEEERRAESEPIGYVDVAQLGKILRGSAPQKKRG